jgi:hypothetical protein
MLQCFFTYKENKMKVNEIWQQLGDVPVNNDGEIETSFLHFEVGTTREEIWSWIEEKFDVSVAELMGVSR